MTTTVEKTEPARRSALRDRALRTGVITQVVVLTGRTMGTLRNPALFIPSLLYPIIMLSIFSQVFRSIDQTPGFPAGVAYIDYLLPAILVTTGLGAGAKTGTILTTEMQNGIIARFKSMPIRTGSILTARSFADLIQFLGEMAVTTALAALIFGFSPAGGFVGVLGAILVSLVVGWSLGWVFMALAAWLKAPQVLEPISSMLTIILMFASNAFVATSTMPTWLRFLSELNPLSLAIEAARELALGTADTGTILAPVAICAVVVLIAAPIATRNFRRG
ncbi:ABC transporter permease [Micromonospora sp. DT201]|uniref:ABC transporter permease n=1 Tax=Micromonospora sp. DT201 TaxID=3393442 RepID=UPI003CF35D54